MKGFRRAYSNVLHGEPYSKLMLDAICGAVFAMSARSELSAGLVLGRFSPSRSRSSCVGGPVGRRRHRGKLGGSGMHASTPATYRPSRLRPAGARYSYSYAWLDRLGIPLEEATLDDIPPECRGQGFQSCHVHGNCSGSSELRTRTMFSLSRWRHQISTKSKSGVGCS